MVDSRKLLTMAFKKRKAAIRVENNKQVGEEVVHARLQSKQVAGHGNIRDSKLVEGGSVVQPVRYAFLMLVGEINQRLNALTVKWLWFDSFVQMFVCAVVLPCRLVS